MRELVLAIFALVLMALAYSAGTITRYEDMTWKVQQEFLESRVRLLESQVSFERARCEKSVELSRRAEVLVRDVMEGLGLEEGKP